MIKAASAGFTPGLTGLGSNAIESTYRNLTNAAIPGLAKANVYRDAVLGRIEAQAAAVNAVLANLEAFADAAAGRAPYPVPQDQMIANVSALEAVFRSVKSGAVETVES